MTTQLPGYTGYLPAYERQYVARAPLAAHKYDDFEKRVPSMMSTSNYQTVYETTVAAKENYHYKPTSSSSSKLQNDSSAMSASLSYELPPQDTIAETFGRPSTQPPSTEKQPGKNDWSTTYGGSFDAWKTVDQTQKWQKIELDTTDPTVITNPNLKDISDNPFSRNRVLRNVEMKSNYQVDFGERGFNPLTRFDTSTGVQNIKLNATTQDLYAGSTKSHPGRIPGYSGFIPSSKQNKHLIHPEMTGILPHEARKDNILQNFKHNVPGYTGHQPKTVMNDLGPRTPQSKCDMPIGLRGTLMLNSMYKS